MIVEPDYFGHWKTRMLVGLTQAKPSEICPLKLWAFCQQRRAFQFKNMTPGKLKAICEWDGCPDLLWEAMHEAGFVRDEDGLLVVHDWDTVNAQLVRNWKNGAKGGRPKKTQKEPSDNPSETQKEPSDNPELTDKSRVDKSRVLPPKSPRGDDAPKGFIRFWEIYPRRVGKAAALRSWQRHKCEAITDKIIASIAPHMESDEWKKDGGEFIPHPATYLNQGRWDDVLEKQFRKTAPDRPALYQGT